MIDNFLIQSIKDGTVVPVISNSFRMNAIFETIDSLTNKIPKEPRSSDEYLTISEQLTREWADFIKYPLPDDHNLARVAQYYQITEKDIPRAKAQYVDFLKVYLVNNSPEDGYESILTELKSQPLDQTFSEIVRQLEYPRFPSEYKDPLVQLANLPLPIYVTTSYYDFLEQALRGAGKAPRTQVCSWKDYKAKKAVLDPDFDPQPETPAVYHLFGMENYPTSLVQSEDDYMNFLISVSEDTNTQNPNIPLKLREALAENLLILLGYNLQDWEFRVLFRLISKFRRVESSPRSTTVIQLKPRPKKIDDETKSLEYLRNYFDNNKFSVNWESADDYIHRLAEEWDKRRGVKS